MTIILFIMWFFNSPILSANRSEQQGTFVYQFEFQRLALSNYHLWRIRYSSRQIRWQYKRRSSQWTLLPADLRFSPKTVKISPVRLGGSLKQMAAKTQQISQCKKFADWPSATNFCSYAFGSFGSCIGIFSLQDFPYLLNGQVKMQPVVQQFGKTKL